MSATDPAAGAGAVVVRLPDGRIARFSRSFHIGRDASCEVHLVDTQVSRRHAEVSRQRDEWIIRDLQSSNGLFVEGQRVEVASIGAGVDVRLGAEGPTLHIGPERAATVVSPPQRPDGPNDSLEQLAQRYFGSDDSDESVGGRTLMIRKAYQQIQQQQKRRQRVIIGLVTLVAVAAAGYALYQHRLVTQQQEFAEGIFYTMKDFDVRLARLEQEAAATGNKASAEQVALANDVRKQGSEYDQLVARLYDRNLSETDRLILKVTRIFGECEVAAPPEYIREVKHYIDIWKRTNRFPNAVKLAKERGYTPRIASAFIAQGLPPQFYYLAMQESSFDAFATGTPTNWGYAKGMWQFIPDTGRRYGLRIGPRAAVPGTDVGDDRFNWEKATEAAARYVKDIYATDAQASGLLVMASYNWGERRVVARLQKMPANPRERNFWQLLAHYREDVPPQTYNYVFNIVSAAVIGENPRLFGFDIDNPLNGFEKR